MSNAEKILASRKLLTGDLSTERPKDCEGGCGVIGIIGSEALAGGLIIRPCAQMRNRGNGKGGGIAAAGLFPEHKQEYALHIGYLKPEVREALEQRFILNNFVVSEIQHQPALKDFREADLALQPPDVWRYFVRVKPNVLSDFVRQHGFLDLTAAEDEFVFQNSFKLNRAYYADLSEPQAFVLSHGKDLMILKGVGYAEEIARFYQLEEMKAHVWIGHQRYPTRGRVWHPGGAHPFAGLHEALVHNGDFANYHAVTEYLKQRGIAPLFVTDTEVSVLLFDLYARVFGYPLEHVIEALGPTPSGDFERLSKRRQRVYRALQTAHIHGSPDGPWFFIIARTDPLSGAPQLIGITDVSMLRPQVFSLQVGKQSFGAIASEKQAIDAFFEEVARSDASVPPCADHYWNARGGSATDGGAFIYTLAEKDGHKFVDVQDKFGNRPFEASVPAEKQALVKPLHRITKEKALAVHAPAANPVSSSELGAALLQALTRCDGAGFESALLNAIGEYGSADWRTLLNILTRLRDQRWNLGTCSLAFARAKMDWALNTLLDSVTPHNAQRSASAQRLTYSNAEQDAVHAPSSAAQTLVIDATGFEPEGSKSVGQTLVRAHALGWKNFIIYRCHGDRFIGCGLGSSSVGTRIDIYGSSGDYLGSGLDGAEIYVHGNAQDQVGQIFKSGRLVIYGDVGQTFLYGAKGGEAFVLGNAAGRPLINAVGSIRAIINGTCLDYCAESFMAGDQLGGGFVIINGLRFNERGSVIGLELKYPGNNLFSLASGGCCYLNDPYATVTEAQLNGASFIPFREADWNLVLPYLKLNEELFGISLRHDLLVVDGVLKWPKEVFRKIVASSATKGLDWSSLTT